MRGLKLLSEPCFCNSKSIILPNNAIASEAYENIRETCIQRGQLKIVIDSLPTLQISLGIVALFEKNYDGELIFTDFSNTGESVQYRYFNVLYYVSTVSQPYIDAMLGNNYCSQRIETGFAEEFKASHRMWPPHVIM